MIAQRAVFPILRFFPRVAWSILDYARRTTTFLSCAFRERRRASSAFSSYYRVIGGALHPSKPTPLRCNG